MHSHAFWHKNGSDRILAK